MKTMLLMEGVVIVCKVLGRSYMKKGLSHIL